MKVKIGTSKEELAALGIVKIEDTQAHLLDQVEDHKCHVCGSEDINSMVLLRSEDKKLQFTCLDHPGAMQQFLKHFKRLPIGWKQYYLGDPNESVDTIRDYSGEEGREVSSNV